MQRINKIVRISLSGGLIGAMLTSPKRALDNAIRKENEEGWYCHQILHHTTSNLAIRFFQIVVLVLTCFLWTFGAGYLLLFVKEAGACDVQGGMPPSGTFPSPPSYPAAQGLYGGCPQQGGLHGPQNYPNQR